jgi:hypothetical protein
MAAAYDERCHLREEFRNRRAHWRASTLRNICRAAAFLRDDTVPREQQDGTGAARTRVRGAR